ncbi:hypothetical protein, partial [Mucilaginibacter sp.]
MKKAKKIKLASMPGRLCLVITAGAMLIGLMAANSSGLNSKYPPLLKDTTKWPATFGFGRAAAVDE